MLDQPTPRGTQPVPPPLLQRDALALLRSLDPQQGNGFVIRVLQTYLRSLDRSLAEVASARASGDVATVRLHMHSLKSSSQHVGATDFSDECAAVERRLIDLSDPAGVVLAEPVLSRALDAVLASAEAVRAAVLAELEGVVAS